MNNSHMIQQKVNNLLRAKQRRVTTAAPHYKNILVVEDADFNQISMSVTSLFSKEFANFVLSLQGDLKKINEEIDEHTKKPKYYFEGMTNEQQSQVREYAMYLGKLYGRQEILEKLIADLKSKY